MIFSMKKKWMLFLGAVTISFLSYPVMAMDNQGPPPFSKPTRPHPKATTFMNLYADLPNTARPGDVPFSQAALIFDAKGGEYNVVVSYQKTQSYTANGAGFPTDNPVPGGTADPLYSERWTLTATAETNTTPPLSARLCHEWAQGVGIVFSDGLPLMISEHNPMPPLVITPPENTGASPINIAVNIGTLNQSDGLTTFSKDFLNYPIIVDGVGAWE
ncbi:MAG: hypothetical protein K2X98_02605 [Alphaproteobacteria bacterium]|nr:hypothetical protein [Alphaproteobacteria bacterium]